MQAKEILFNLLRDLRRLEYLLQTDSLEGIDPVLTEQLIKGGMSENAKLRDKCIDDLRDLIKHKQGTDVNIRTLRDKAQVLGIKNWSRLSREVLLIKIKKAEDGIGKSNGTTSGITSEASGARTENHTNSVSQ